MNLFVGWERLSRFDGACYFKILNPFRCSSPGSTVWQLLRSLIRDVSHYHSGLCARLPVRCHCLPPPGALSPCRRSCKSVGSSTRPARDRRVPLTFSSTAASSGSSSGALRVRAPQTRFQDDVLRVQRTSLRDRRRHRLAGPRPFTPYEPIGTPFAEQQQAADEGPPLGEWTAEALASGSTVPPPQPLAVAGLSAATETAVAGLSAATETAVAAASAATAAAATPVLQQQVLDDGTPVPRNSLGAGRFYGAVFEERLRLVDERIRAFQSTTAPSLRHGVAHQQQYREFPLQGPAICWSEEHEFTGAIKYAQGARGGGVSSGLRGAACLAGESGWVWYCASPCQQQPPRFPPRFLHTRRGTQGVVGGAPRQRHALLYRSVLPGVLARLLGAGAGRAAPL